MVAMGHHIIMVEVVEEAVFYFLIGVNYSLNWKFQENKKSKCLEKVV